MKTVFGHVSRMHPTPIIQSHCMHGKADIGHSSIHKYGGHRHKDHLLEKNPGGESAICTVQKIKTKITKKRGKKGKYYLFSFPR